MIQPRGVELLYEVVVVYMLDISLVYHRRYPIGFH